MNTSINIWDAFKNHMEQLYFEGILAFMSSEEITFAYDEFINLFKK